MQLLLITLPQPRLQINDRSFPYQGADLYALAPNRFYRGELQVLCECLQNTSDNAPPPGAYQETPEITRLGMAL